MKKTLFIILVLPIILCVLSLGTSAAALDLDNCWAKDQVEAWIDSGILSCYPDGTFRPDNRITRAEFMAIINNAFHYTEKAEITYSDVPADSGYAVTIQRAKAAGYISGYRDGTIKPDSMITRQEAATMIAKINKLDGNKSAAEAFTDSHLLPEWCKAAVGAVVQAKIMSGYPDGTFRGSDYLSRAEAVVGLKQAAEYTPENGKLYDQAGIYGPKTGNQTIDGDVTVGAGGIELRNLIIRGNLIIDQSLGKGALTLRNVTVNGQTSIKGNEEFEIGLVDTNLSTATILESGDRIRVVAFGDSLIERTIIRSGVKLEESKLTGDGFREVIIEEVKKNTITFAGRFERVQVGSADAVLDLPQGTTIIVLEVKAKSKVTGTGIVQRAEIQASGVVFDYAPQQINTAAGVTAPTILYPVVSANPGGNGGVPQPVQQQVANPTVSLNPGTYEGQQNVTLASATSGAAIWYTLDGSDPKTSVTRQQYTAAITISSTVTLKTYATKADMLDSEVQSFSYIINLDSIHVAADKNALQPGFAIGDSASAITANINLPLTGASGSAITWSSDNPAVISTTGIVTRGNTDQTVTLTATLTKGTASATKLFTVTVKAAEKMGNYSRSYPVMAYDPENNRYMMVYFKNDKVISDYNLYGRLVDLNGEYIGNEFPIRTSVDTGDDFSFKPDIAYDSTNHVFLVVWNQFGPPWDVYGQILNPDGSKAGEAFAISDLQDDKRQNAPFVAFDNINKKFLVAYRHNIDANEVQDDIYGRFVSIVAGSPVVGEDFLIAGGMWYQDLHDVAFNGTDTFMVPIGSYESNRLVAVNSNTGAASNACVFGSTAYRPSLAYDHVNHQFLAAWFASNRIYGRFINQDGTADGDPFQISDGMVNGYGNVTVGYTEGYFYVAWQNEKVDDDMDIYAKKIDAASKVLSPQITVAAGAESTLCPFFGSGSEVLLAWTIESEPEPKAIGLRPFAAQVTAASFTSAPQAEDITLPEPITVSLKSDKTATLYYAVVQEDVLGYETPAPTAQQLKILGTPIEGTYPDSYGVVPVPAAGFQTVTGQSTEQVTIPTTEGFNAMRTYTVYMVLETGEGIFSAVTGVTFNTLADNDAPVFNQTGNITGVYLNKARSLIINEKTLDDDENYDLYIWAVKAAEAPSGTPSATDVKANGKLYEYLTSGEQHVITCTGLDPATSYKVYMVAQDYSGTIEGLYSAVLTNSTTTLASDPGPDLAGLLGVDEDSYVFSNEGPIQNKYLFIQLDQQLAAQDAAALAANIRIYDFTSEKTLAVRGDTVTILGDTIRIAFAVPPSEDFHVYINDGAVKAAGTLLTNKYEISITVNVPDIIAPVVETDYPKGYAAGTNDQTIAAEICLNEDAAVFWALLPAGAGGPQYESNIVDRKVSNTLNYGSLSMEKGVPAVISIPGLQPGTSYDLWLTAIDGNNNYMGKQKITLTTTAD